MRRRLCLTAVVLNIVAERSFDLRTSGYPWMRSLRLWAQHASAAPLCLRQYLAYSNHDTAKCRRLGCRLHTTEQSKSHCDLARLSPNRPEDLCLSASRATETLSALQSVYCCLFSLRSRLGRCVFCRLCCASPRQRKRQRTAFVLFYSNKQSLGKAWYTAIPRVELFVKFVKSAC